MVFNLLVGFLQWFGGSKKRSQIQIELKWTGISLPHMYELECFKSQLKIYFFFKFKSITEFTLAFCHVLFQSVNSEIEAWNLERCLDSNVNFPTY